MAQKTAAEIAEIDRRRALTTEQRDEEDRRAGLTDDERDLEDRAKANGISVEEQAEFDKLEVEEQAKANPQARLATLRNKQIAGQKAIRAKEATVEAIIAPGRSVFTEHGQTQPHVGGDKVMLTPEEYAKLVAAGHVRTPEGDLVERSGPKILSDAGLIQGHSAGQGNAAQK
jgi:hypothetical protein